MTQSDDATLDLATVLGEVVESARALIGARKGVIVTLDEAGAPQAPVFSGLTPEEERQQLAWPGNASLFVHLRSLPGPVRVADFPAYVSALGIVSPWTISRTFQGMPMRHRGREVGSFSLSDKADGEAFTAEDEEVLALFASQAASAIANARTHESERRARADLEALVETSPIGVVVFDATSGRAVSFNREARRIVERLRTPGHPPEQLLEVITVRPPARRFGHYSRTCSSIYRCTRSHHLARTGSTGPLSRGACRTGPAERGSARHCSPLRIGHPN